MTTRWTVVTGHVRRYGNLAVAVVLTGAWVVQADRYPGDHLLTAGCGLAAGVALAVRRYAPLAAFVVVAAALVAVSHVSPTFFDDSLTPVFALMVVLYGLGADARGVEAVLGAVGVLAAAVAVALQDPSNEYSVGDFAFYVVLCGLPWGLGLALRLRVDRVRESEVRHATIREESERAVAEERRRIARELHDVVSHAIAVTVLQARGATKLVGRDDEAVRTSLRAVEQTNTAALADMRRLLSLLRSQDTAPGGREEPAPGLNRLEHLLDQVRASGLEVELSVDGRPLPVPPGLDLSAYRIVQEALTNVLKHGGPQARALVRVTYDADDLRVEVTNIGTVDPAQPSSGHGLVGIRERVAVAGGTVDAGPHGEGFAVRASMPYLVGAS